MTRNEVCLYVNDDGSFAGVGICLNPNSVVWIRPDGSLGRVGSHAPAKRYPLTVNSKDFLRHCAVLGAQLAEAFKRFPDHYLTMQITSSVVTSDDAKEHK